MFRYVSVSIPCRTRPCLLHPAFLVRFSAALVEEFRLDRRISNAVAFAQAYGSAISFVFYASLVFLSSVFMNAGLMGPDRRPSGSVEPASAKGREMGRKSA